jgi:hypothetical protein
LFDIEEVEKVINSIIEKIQYYTDDILVDAIARILGVGEFSYVYDI